MKIKTRIVEFFRVWLPPILWAGVIYLFSANPTTEASEIHWQDFIVKKTAHIFEYAVLTALLYRGFRLSGFKNKRSGYWAVLLAIFYGASDEFHQSFTPGREPTIRDVVFDTMGAVLAIYSVWNLLAKAPKRLKSLAKRWRIA